MAGAEVATTTTISPERVQPIIPEGVQQILPQTLSRLSAGLPKHELDIVIKEARACEDALEREIAMLEDDIGIENNSNRPSANKEKPPPTSPLKEPKMTAIPGLPPQYQPGSGDINYLDSVDACLATEFSPPDRYFTVSALLGRLREPLKLPLPPNSRMLVAAQSLSLPNNKVKKVDPQTEEKKKKLALEKQHTLAAMENDAMYNMEHTDTTALLNLYKRISSHRTAAIFRKPVNPLEAPGYKERILFPIDLSLIRKMIVARMIKSFASLHQRIALICHNCVKFNGRESDYSIVTRDFEDMVDDKILDAVKNTKATTSTMVPIPSTPAIAPTPAASTVDTAVAPSSSTTAVASTEQAKK